MTLYICTEYAPVVPIRAEDITDVALTPVYAGQRMLEVGICRFGRCETHRCHEITSSKAIAADYTQLHLYRGKK